MNDSSLFKHAEKCIKARSPLEKVRLNLKEIVKIEIEVKNAQEGTSQIIQELEKHNLEDKIILLRIRGELEQGKNSDIKFAQIEE